MLIIYTHQGHCSRTCAYVGPVVISFLCALSLTFGALCPPFAPSCPYEQQLWILAKGLSIPGSHVIPIRAIHWFLYSVPTSITSVLRGTRNRCFVTGCWIENVEPVGYRRIGTVDAKQLEAEIYSSKEASFFFFHAVFGFSFDQPAFGLNIALIVFVPSWDVDCATGVVMLLFLKMTVYTFQSKCQTYFFPHGLTLILLRVYMATFPYLLPFFSFPFSINLTSFCFLCAFRFTLLSFFPCFLSLFSFRDFFFTRGTTFTPFCFVSTSQPPILIDSFVVMCA